MLGNLFNSDQKNDTDQKSLLTTLEVEKQNRYSQSEYNNNYSKNHNKHTDLSQKEKTYNNQELLNSNRSIQLQHQKQSSKQESFSLEKSKLTRIELLRKNLQKWEQVVSVMPYWKIAVNPINITLSLVTSFFTILIIYSNLHKFPNQIYLFYSQVDNTRFEIDKTIFAFLPIIISVVELIILRLEKQIFDFDRRLSQVISMSQIFFNILLILALLEIISLMLK